MRRMVLYDDLVLGTQLPTHARVFTTEEVERYRAAAQMQTDPYEGAIPPLLLNGTRALKDSLPGTVPPGGLHAFDRLAVDAWVHPPTEVRTSIRVADRYVKRDRRYVVFEQAIEGDGVRLLTSRGGMTWTQ